MVQETIIEIELAEVAKILPLKKFTINNINIQVKIMIISHKYKFIFICNMKTGTTSIEKSLNLFQDMPELNFAIHKITPHRHVPPSFIKASLPKSIWDSYFKFVFVRNPWDWFVSQWKYHFQPRYTKLSNLLDHPKGSLENIVNYGWYKKMSSRTVFSVEDVDYLFEFLKTRRGLPTASGLYQSTYVFDIDGNQIVDFVGRFEKLDDDFSFIKQKLNLEINLPHLNKTKRKDYRKYFTTASKHKVYDLWEKDIKAFKYTFDYTPDTF